MKDNKCCLCSQIAGDEDGDLIHSLLGSASYVRHVAFETEQFALIPSLGPLTDGHVLMCPKQHVKSLVALPEELSEEYECLKRGLIAVMRQTYGHPIHCFEHGSARNSNRILCTVDHAHLHILPAAVDAAVVLAGMPRCTHYTGGLATLRRLVGSGEYIYYESPNGDCHLAVSDGEIFPSQLMRRVFAQALGRGPTWNWRSSPHVADAVRTCSELSMALLR
jgi:diadenosine tetraphosphate (Ap4A) HIT family hydrolase